MWVVSRGLIVVSRRQQRFVVSGEGVGSQQIYIYDIYSGSGAVNLCFCRSALKQ